LEAADTWLGLNEVQAIFITATAAAMVAIWGIASQRSITSRQTTIQYIREAERDADMIAARKKFNELAKQPDGLGPWGTDANSTSPEAQSIRMVLNEYELIAIGIQRGILDDKTYRLWHRSAVIKNWRQASPYVIAVRMRTNNDAIFHEFEEMARWYRGGPNMPKRRFFWRKFF
jgi:hypothetical protein